MDPDVISTDVESDVVPVMQVALDPIRRPAARALVVIGIAVVIAIVGAGVLSRLSRRDAKPTPQ